MLSISYKKSECKFFCLCILYMEVWKVEGKVSISDTSNFQRLRNALSGSRLRNGNPNPNPDNFLSFSI